MFWGFGCISGRVYSYRFRQIWFASYGILIESLTEQQQRHKAILQVRTVHSPQVQDGSGPDRCESKGYESLKISTDNATDRMDLFSFSM